MEIILQLEIAIQIERITIFHKIILGLKSNFRFAKIIKILKMKQLILKEIYSLKNNNIN